MKYYIFFLSLFAVLQLNAQTLQVRVVDSNGLILSYAGVYINQSLNCITDLDGIAFIPFNKLNYGDTITSTYIGMETASIIFNKKVQDLSMCTITLTNDKVYELNPVIIKAFVNDDWKFFHKNVKTYHTVIYQNCIVTGKFKAEVQLPQDSISHNIEGTFELKNLMPRKIPASDFFKYYFATLPEIETSVQDTAVKNRAISAIRQSISVTCQTIARIHWERWSNSKYSKVTYLGINDNCHFFRIVYTNNEYKNLLSFQTLFSVNMDNQEVENVEYYIPLKIHSGSLDREKLLSAVCQKLLSKNGQKIEMTVPAGIVYNDKLKDNTMLNLTLSDLSFHIIK